MKNETTVRPNDKTIAIEIRKNARESAELSNEMAPHGSEEDF